MVYKGKSQSQMDDLGVSAFQETTLGGSPGVMPRGYDTTNLGQGSG
jgi:hypothetical protein